MENHDHDTDQSDLLPVSVVPGVYFGQIFRNMRDHDNEDSEGEEEDHEGDQEDENEWDENEWNNDEYEDIDEDDEDDPHSPGETLHEIDSDGDASSVLDDRDDPDFIASLNASDVWDENSRNHFERNLTRSIVELQRRLRREHARAPWNSSPPSPFFRVEQGWPKQIPFSRSTSNHFQCANSLCLASSNHGIDHNLFTVFRENILKCGVQPDKQTTEVARKDTEGATTPPPAFTTPLTRYTKYIAQESFSSPTYLKLTFAPLCLAHQYGYLVVGGERGGFVVYCTMNPSKEPVEVWKTPINIDNRRLMTNSVQIVRWKIRNNLDEEHEYDTNNEHSNQFEYNVIVSINEGGVLVYSLPCHQDCYQQPDSETKSEHFGRSITVQQTPIVKLDMHLNIFDECPINDTKVSPDGTWMVCVGDRSMVFLVPVICRQALTSSTAHSISFGPIKKLRIPHSLLSSSARYGGGYTSQYVSWNSQSTLFAHTSDSHKVVLVWTVRPKHEILHVISTAGLTYAISFHPVLPGVLTYAYYYGYIHTVNLGETVEIPAERAKSVTGVAEMRNLMEYSQKTDPNKATENLMEEDLTPNANCSDHHLAYHTSHLSPRQEITMFSFRDANRPSTRILDKINGLVWSPDGCRLYIATERRVLCYEFTRSTREVPSLMKICSGMFKSVFENHERSQTRKGQGDLPTEILGQTQIVRDRLGSLKRSRIGLANIKGNAEGKIQLEVDWKRWQKGWAFAPANVKRMVFGDDFGLASHY